MNLLRIKTLDSINYRLESRKLTSCRILRKYYEDLHIFVQVGGNKPLEGVWAFCPSVRICSANTVKLIIRGILQV